MQAHILEESTQKTSVLFDRDMNHFASLELRKLHWYSKQIKAAKCRSYEVGSEDWHSSAGKKVGQEQSRKHNDGCENCKQAVKGEGKDPQQKRAVCCTVLQCLLLAIPLLF